MSGFEGIVHCHGRRLGAVLFNEHRCNAMYLLKFVHCLPQALSWQSLIGNGGLNSSTMPRDNLDALFYVVKWVAGSQTIWIDAGTHRANRNHMGSARQWPHQDEAFSYQCRPLRRAALARTPQLVGVFRNTGFI